MSKHTNRDGRWVKGSIFTYLKLDEAGAGDYFETVQTKTDAPTLILNGYRSHEKLKTGIIHRIHYRLKPTAGVTFILRLWRSAEAADYASNLSMLYESPALQASDVDYDRAELAIPFWLTTPGYLYYSIEWSGAPGNTMGFIDVTGEVVE